MPDLYIGAIPNDSPLGSLGARINRAPANEQRRATAFAFRVDEQFVHRISDPGAEQHRAAAVGWSGGRPIYLFVYSAAKKRHEVFRVTRRRVAPPPRSSLLISRIRSADLASIIRESQDYCFLEASPNYHFVTPSRVHCSLFLRVGDAIQSAEVLDRFAFWLMPNIAQADAIVIDTLGIASIAIRAMQWLKRDVPFVFLPSHPLQDFVSAERVLDGMVLPLPTDAKVFVIVSLAITGNILKSVEQILRVVGSRKSIQSEGIVLYAFKGTLPDIEPFCCLEHEIEYYVPPNDCRLCTPDNVPLYIDGHLNYPREIQETDLALTADHFHEALKFLAKYQSMDRLLRVHRDDPNDWRHHAFDIDVSTLLEQPQFLEAYMQELRNVAPTPDLVVAPDHQPGRALAKLASQMFDIPFVIHNDLRFGGTRASANRNLVKGSRNLLIVDDVSNTGSRLSKYNRALREEFGHFKSVVFLVAVARPQSEAAWRELRVSLTNHHPWNASLLFIEKICLPAWDAKFCPWCQEHDLLSRACQRFSLPPKWIKDRVGKLTEKLEGLVEDVLFLLPGVSAKHLARGAVAGMEGFSPIQVTFAVASALQSLRNAPEEKHRLAPHFPARRVFGLRNLTNYSEGLLRASLLRLLRAYEWGNTNRSKLQSATLDYVGHDDQHVLQGEVVLAIARNAIPAPDPGVLTQRIPTQDASDLLALLRIA